jgi:hypothetical protein
VCASGESYNLVVGKPGISESTHAYDEFWKYYGEFDEVELVVTAKEGLI